jgi:cardiolipin synthase
MNTNNHNQTSWTLFASNDEAWNSILEDCKNATESIDLEQFIFSPDEFGTKLIDICTQKASQGVKIRFLWDAIGSFSFFGSNIIEDLKNKNVELRFWKTLIPSYFNVPDYRSWFLRNHRRTIVIDNKIGYTGSICIKEAMRNWRDTNVRLEGNVVASMQDAFNKMWQKANNKKVNNHRRLPRDTEFSYITNDPSPRKRYMYQSTIEAIRGAQKYIYITTPYFVPTHRLARVIRLAAHRGVDVRIIIPQSSNVLAIDLGARSFFDKMLESGVRIFLYTGEMVHSKTMVIDGIWSTVGSLNLDSVSLLYNFEANIVSLNSKFAEELASIFVRDMQNAKEITIMDRNKMTFIEKIPEKMMRLIGKFL